MDKKVGVTESNPLMRTCRPQRMTLQEKAQASLMRACAF